MKDAPCRSIPGSLARLGHWLAFLCYSLITCMMMGAALADVRGSVIGRRDLHVWEELWHFWWTRQALLTGHSPFQTSLLGFPNGFNVFYDMSSITLPIASLPLQPIFGVVGAYNMLALFALTAAAYGAYRVCYRLSHHPLASFAGGCIFGFSPFLQAELSNGMMENVFAFALLPYVLLFLLRMNEHPNWKHGLAGGLLLGVAALSSWYVVPVAAVLILLTLSVAWFKKNSDDRKKLLVSYGVLAVVLAMILAGPVGMLLRGPALARGVSLEDCVHPPMHNKSCPNILHFVSDNTPPYQTPTPGSVDPQVLPFGIYAGKVVIFLLLLAWLIREPGWRPWKAGVIIFLLLALGPYLNLNGRLLIPLPNRLLAMLPGCTRIFALHNYRFVAGLMLLAGILAALVLAKTLDRLQLGRRACTIAVIVICWLILVDFATTLRQDRPLLLPTAQARIPAVFQALAEAGEGGILNVPTTSGAQGIPHVRGLQMFHQTLHQHPMWCDPIWQTDPADHEPTLVRAARSAAMGHDWTWAAAEVGEELKSLHKQGFRFIVVYGDWMTSTHRDRYETMLFKQLGNPVMEDGAVNIYAIP